MNDFSSDSLLLATLNSIGDGVILTDTDSRVTFLIPAAGRLTGWKQSQAAGQPLDTVFTLVKAGARKPLRNPTDRALRADDPVELPPHTILVAKDGAETAIDDSAAPIKHTPDPANDLDRTGDGGTKRAGNRAAAAARSRTQPHGYDAGATGVLLNPRMPRLNGFETAERLRAQADGQSIMFIALTGYGQEEHRRRMAAAGFDRHWVKPIDPAPVEKILNEVTQNKR